MIAKPLCRRSNRPSFMTGQRAYDLLKRKRKVVIKVKCSICHKNTAVVFMSKVEGGKQERIGLCLPCAKRQGIAPLNDLLAQTGMSPEEMNNLNDQMMEILDDPQIGDQINQFMASLDNGFVDPTLETIEGAEESVHEHLSAGEDVPHGAATKTKVKAVRKIKRKNLDQFGINLTEKAKAGEVDRIIGREREIDRVIQILNRRQKNNPVLIGEPGVGKTAIAEGLAVRIAEGNVPHKLLGTEIYLLDLPGVVSGTQFRGQFEARMKAILHEAMESGNVILVIDEIHNITGAGGAESGSMNAANILKPALARGDIQVIGATTLEEYRKHIEKDSALERRFQKVLVEEPDEADSIEIIKGITVCYENFHHVMISDEVIAYAVHMSKRYIHERYLPDKAIDLIDEAGSRANLRNLGLVELEALKNELAKTVEEKEIAAASDDYEKAADCRMDELRLENKIKEIEKQCDQVELTEELVADVIESWTKIPVQKLTEEEAVKLKNLNQRLNRWVKGQDRAITAVSTAIKRRRSGFMPKLRPASFVFVGPTGVGKTELAKAVARELFGSEDALIRFDMSEFMEKHTASKLIGAPPGYIGYDNAGQLTERVRRRPYSVILLDEIEKAHPDIFHLLLQILEDGRLTDSQGRTVNFENTIVLMTSNAGTDRKGAGIGFNPSEAPRTAEKVKAALHELFKPEFLNRLDDIIVFDNLTPESLTEIVDIMLEQLRHMTKEKGFDLEVSDEVKAFLVKDGYQEAYGARPLRRSITVHIEDRLSEMFLDKELENVKLVRFVMEDDKIKAIPEK